MLHFYKFSYEALLALPLKTFWLMNNNIDRIWAQQDMRALALAVIGQSTQQSVVAYREQLVLEAGTIVELDRAAAPEPQRDEAGFAELKRMAN